MDRTQFIIATAIILFVAFCLGWFAHWLIHRFRRVSQADVDQLERMSQELHEAEETRDQAITYLQQREAELTNQLAQTEAERNSFAPAASAGTLRTYATLSGMERGRAMLNATTRPRTRSCPPARPNALRLTR